jgi:adenosine deaminase
MVEQVLEHRPEELIGLGMDEPRRLTRPSNSSTPTASPSRAGSDSRPRLRGRACKEHHQCLDLLGCERIDHGYHILGDESVVERCKGEGSRPPSADRNRRLLLRPDDYTTHPIREMVSRGLKVMVNPTTVDVPHGHRREYAKMAAAADWSSATSASRA